MCLLQSRNSECGCLLTDGTRLACGFRCDVWAAAASIPGRGGAGTPGLSQHRGHTGGGIELSTKFRESSTVQYSEKAPTTYTDTVTPLCLSALLA